jgi:hypothetical protein
MRFNDGFWLLKNGVKPFYGLQATQVTSRDDAFHLTVATKPIRHRGDTLGGPLLSVKVHSPTDGVIGVSLQHLLVANPAPHIPLFPNLPPQPSSSLALSSNGDVHTLSSGPLSAVITQNPYTLSFNAHSNRTLTFAGPRHQAIFDVPSRWAINSASNSSCLAQDPSSNPSPDPLPPVIRYINSELNLSPGELIYGLGEQFGPFIKNGKSFFLSNRLRLIPVSCRPIRQSLEPR